MANIKSQKKRVKTNAKAHERNLAVKTSLKTAVKKVRQSKEFGDAEKALKAAARKLDKAVSAGVIHKNQAAKRKSKLAKGVAKISADNSTAKKKTSSPSHPTGSEDAAQDPERKVDGK